MPSLQDINSAEKIAQAGEEIYANHRARLEQESPGQFAAIDVVGEQVYVSDSSVDALTQATQAAPTGVFHLVQIGSPTAIRNGFLSSHA